MNEKQLHILGAMLINLLTTIPVLWIAIEGNKAPSIMYFLLLVWGFYCFRWVARNILGGTFMHVPMSMKNFFLVNLFGAIVFASFSILVVPIVLAYQGVKFMAASNISGSS